MKRRGLGKHWTDEIRQNPSYGQGCNHGWKVEGDQSLGLIFACAPHPAKGRAGCWVRVRGYYRRHIFENPYAKSCILVTTCCEISCFLKTTAKTLGGPIHCWSPTWLHGLSDHAQRLYGKCVRLSWPLVGFWTHFKSPHFHFISFQSWGDQILAELLRSQFISKLCTLADPRWVNPAMPPSWF